MKVLFDTSVLVAALIVSHPHHPACFFQLQAAKSKQVQGFISTHSLAETYASRTTRTSLEEMVTIGLAGGVVYDALAAKAALIAGANILPQLNAKDFLRLGPAVSTLVLEP